MANRFGWRPDTPDHRDAYRAPRAATLAELPAAVDLRPLFPEPPWDQGEMGSCIFQALAAALQYQLVRQGFPVWMPSRLFWYYNVRQAEGTGSEDAGGQIRTGIKEFNRLGACYEALWPYDAAHFAPRPDPACYEVAENHQALRYARVQQYSTHLKAALAEGAPIIFGATLYQSFESEAVRTSGIVPYPDRLEAPIGGHAMLAVGYEGADVIVRNSWGPGWGQGGYCRMPFDYLCSTNLADDFWQLSLIE